MDSIKMCRACLSPEGRARLLDWYQPVESLEYVLSYKECFCKCTQISMTENNERQSQFLCYCCAKKLKEAYNFIEKAKQADDELRCMKTQLIPIEDMPNRFEWVSVKAKQIDAEKSAENTTETKIDDIQINTVCQENEQRDGDLKAENTFKLQCYDEHETELLNQNEFDSFSNNTFKSKIKTHAKTKMKLKKMDELVNCEECKKIMTRKALIKHKPRHKPKVFLCQACPKTFRESNGLKNHELIHQENRERYPCDKCNQTFLSPYSYKKHVQTHENNRKPIYKCTQCEKSFLHKNGLTIHELHHKGASIECNICKKRYVRQIDLDTHLRTHSGESPFVCHICGKSFIHKRILNRHLQYHELYFSYTCLTCGEKFSKYDKYYSHRMRHTGLPYKCGACGKQFPDAYKIKRHIKGVHKVEKHDDLENLVVRINITKEHRGRIVEVLKNPEEENPT
ncbi:zinc finger protein 91-like [Bactrocera neohumeralis]|uniref:zinc finger protein 91-like n=1 Tax=Bactrocera neohumeralis TaxID=98809 RepID=UPI00216554FC|nr:zinc finger protein 91-like [Bactrocera neohumeralis]XP_050328150.1 zinc finger protein 91-like [Bactrocera neohumeralis]